MSQKKNKGNPQKGKQQELSKNELSSFAGGSKHNQQNQQNQQKPAQPNRQNPTPHATKNPNSASHSPKKSNDCHC